MWLTFGNQPHKFNLYMTKLPGTDINVFFVKNDWYFLVLRKFIQNIWTLAMNMKDIFLSL